MLFICLFNAETKKTIGAHTRTEQTTCVFGVIIDIWIFTGDSYLSSCNSKDHLTCSSFAGRLEKQIDSQAIRLLILGFSIQEQTLKNLELQTLQQGYPISAKQQSKTQLPSVLVTIQQRISQSKGSVSPEVQACFWQAGDPRQNGAHDFVPYPISSGPVWPSASGLCPQQKPSRVCSVPDQAGTAQDSAGCLQLLPGEYRRDLPSDPPGS